MTKEERILRLRKEIGGRLKELREAADLSLEFVAGRMDQGDRSYLSKIENGKANPTIDFLCELILFGLDTTFERFCERWLVEDKKRQKEELDARQTLEKLLSKGRATREATIGLLDDLLGQSERGRGSK